MYVSCRASQTSDKGPIFKIPSPLWTYLQSYALGLNRVPPKFIWWGPNQPPSPLPHSVWLYLEIDRPYTEVIRVKWGQKGRALINRTSLLTPKSVGGGWEAGEVLSLSLSLPLNALKEEGMWAHSQMAVTHKPKRSGLRINSTLLTPWAWTSRPQEWWEINFYCLGHPVCGTGLCSQRRQMSLHNTQLTTRVPRKLNTSLTGLYLIQQDEATDRTLKCSRNVKLL